MPDLGQDSTAVNDGVSLFKEGRYTEAIPLLKDRLASNPDDIQVRTFLAASYSQTGSKIDAIMEFIRITEIDPGNAQHYFNLGVAYEGTGNLIKAKESFEKTLSLNPNHPKAPQRLNAIKQQAMAAANASPKPDIQASGSLGGLDQGEMLSAQKPSYGTPPPAYAPQPPPPAARPFASEPVGPPPGLNWGGFLLPFWWSIAHGAWLWAVISFFVGLVGSIFLLIKGNEVAFQNRQFSSMDQFRAVQKAWTLWGIIVNVGAYVLAFIFWGTIMAIFMGTAMKTMPNQGMNVPGMQSMPGMESMPGMFDIKPSSGTGSISVVEPYTGSQKGGTTNGSDADGSFTSTSYTASADFNTVFEYFKGVAQQSGNYSSMSSGSTGDLSMSTQGGMAKIHIESDGGKTTYTINQYGK